MAEETILVKVVLEAGEYKAEIEKISQVSGTAEKAVSGLEESTKGLGAQLQKGVGLSEFKKGADEVTNSLSRQKGVVEQIEQDIKELNKQLSNTAPGKAQQTLQKEVNAANRVLKEEIAILKGIQSETEKVGTKKVKLSARVRQLRNELVELELAGKRDTEEFRRLSKEAGDLTDAIGDISQQTKNLASDTGNLDAFAQGVQGVAGGFAAAQGFAALFGEENEDVQRALLKVQATLAIVNGLQAVFNTIQKQTAFSLKANAAATTIATGAMRLFGVAVNTTSTAFKILRGAIIATGIGAIVAIIGTLASKLDSVSGSAKDSADSFKELNKQIQDLKSKTDELRVEALKSSIRLAVAQGKYTELLGKEKITLLELQEEQKKLSQQRIDDRVKEKTATQLAIEDLEKEKNAIIFKRSEAYTNVEKKIQKIKEESAIRLNEIDSEYEEQRTLGSKIANEIIEIDRLESAKKGNKKVTKETKNFLDEFQKLTLDSFNNTLDEEGRLNQENFAKRRSLIDAFDKLTDKEKLEKKGELDAALLLLETELQDKITKLRLEGEEKAAAEIAKIRKQQTNDTLLNIDTEASKRRRENKETLKDELKDNDDKLAAILETFEGSEAEKANLIEKSEENASNIRKKYADIDAAYAQEIFNSSLQLTNSLFSLQSSLRQKEIAEIQKQKEIELANFQGTEEQRARIEEKFAAKEKQARIQAAQQERDRAIFEATIQTALNVLKAGTNPLLIALAVASGAVQIAAIKSAPLPTFEKGGKVEGKSHRLGGTIIEAERDEFVVNKKAVRKHEPFIEAINKADGSFERMVFDKFVFPKIADLSPSQATILKATFKSDKIEKELRMSRKADQKNTKLLAGIMQSERHHSQSERYKW
jgi:hypothetical protein